jgi:phosphate transport system protein
MATHSQEEIDELKHRLLYMAGLVEEMVVKSTQALNERKPALFQEVFDRESQVNTLQLEVDDRALKVLALQHPLARDLRFVVSAMKASTDLERMGDQAVNISQNAQIIFKSGPAPDVEALEEIPRMTSAVCWMVREGLNAFVTQAVERAKEVLDRDNEVDALKNKVLERALKVMRSQSTEVQSALAIILISRNLERIGDHATNIAEEAIYVELGQDIRHHSQESKVQGSGG